MTELPAQEYVWYVKRCVEHNVFLEDGEGHHCGPCSLREHKNLETLEKPIRQLVEYFDRVDRSGNVHRYTRPISQPQEPGLRLVSDPVPPVPGPVLVELPKDGPDAA